MQYDDFNLSRSYKDDGPALKTIKTAIYTFNFMSMVKKTTNIVFLLPYNEQENVIFSDFLNMICFPRSEDKQGSHNFKLIFIDFPYESNNVPLELFPILSHA